MGLRSVWSQFFPSTSSSSSVFDTTWRAASFVIGLLVMSVSGSVYMFSVYSGPIGDHLGYSATELAFIVTFGQSVYYVAAVPMGMIADWDRIGGGRMASFLGAVFNLVAYLLMMWTYTGSLPNSNYLLFALYYSLTGIGGAAPYAGALAVNVKIYPETVRGIIVGLHVAVYALSSLIFTSINTALFLDDVPGFLLLLALVVGGVNLLGAVFLYDLRRLQPVAPTFLVTDSWSSAGEEDAVGVDSTAVNGATDPPLRPRVPQSQIAVAPASDDEPATPTATEASPLIPGGEGGSSTRRIKPAGSLVRQRASLPVLEGISGWALFRTPDFWLLFAALGLGAGCGLMYINNVGAMVRALAFSLPYSEEETQRIVNSHVSTISACNALARIGVGLLSDLLLKHHHVPRPYVLVFSACMALLGQITVLFVSTLSLLYISSVLVGITYGFFFSLIPTIVGDVFGPRAFGTNLGWVVLSPAIGGPITNLFFGWVYDSHSFEQDGEHFCDGVPCFRSAFFLTVCLEVVVVVLAAFFAWRRYKLDPETAGI